MTTSSRVRVYMGCSLDGVVAGPDDDLTFLADPGPVGSPAASAGALSFDEFMAQVGALLMGRKTFDVVAEMETWPYGSTPVLVATHRPLATELEGVSAVSGSLQEIIEQAKAAAGSQDVYLDGGTLVRHALNEGLVDELCLTFVPLLHGDGGVRLFDGLRGATQLEFLSHHTFVNGAIQVVARPRA